jgi:hypothetical protein
MTTTAETIYNQLGGTKFQIMVGVHTYVKTDNSIRFIFKGCRTANKCLITLQNDDTYTMAFYKFNRRTGDCELVKEISMVYGDQLQDVFQNTTGLVTHL